jgi:hypothetical protein
MNMQLDKSFAYSSDFPIYTFFSSFYLSYFLCNSYFFLRIVQNYLFKLVRNPPTPRAIIVKSDGQHVPCRCRNDPDSIRINILLVLLTLQCVEVDDSKSKIIDQTMQNIAPKNGRKSIPFAKRTTVI